MKFKKILSEITQNTNTKISSLQQEIENHKILSKYILKAMPFTYKSGYSLNIMMNSYYKKEKNKENIKDTLIQLAKKYNGRVKSLDNDSVIKIFVQ